MAPHVSALLVGVHCGLRLRSDALRLRWQDVDLARRPVTVGATYAKSGHTRSVPLNSVVLAALARLPKKSEWVFAKPNGIPYIAVRGFGTACRRAGLTGVTPHTLRHTFASRLVENGVDPIKVTKLAGWSSIKMLDRYAHADPSRLAEAVEGLARQSSTGSTTSENRKLVTC